MDDSGKPMDYWMETYEDPFNKRIRLDDYAGAADQVAIALIRAGERIAAEKIIVKSRIRDMLVFIEQGFSFEGWIDRYFQGDDACILAKYLSPKRKVPVDWEGEEAVLQSVLKLTRELREQGVVVQTASEKDCESLAAFYQTIFLSYPVPIQQPDYIKKAMDNGTIYSFIEHEGKIVSAASAEVNGKYRNAELTDCATLHAYRKEGLIKSNLTALENILQEQGIYTAYSLSRALSYGMNKAFFQLGYSYRGRLANNCYFDHQLEGVNIWVKHLV